MQINKADVIQNEQDYVVQSYTRPPFVLVKGEGVTVYDSEGNAYQDWAAGIAVNALGYGDDGLKQILNQQLDTGLIHLSNLYHTQPHAELAKALCDTSFADRVFFANTGTEANEGAIKFARKRAYQNGKTNKTEVVCFSDAFHGRTLASLSLTPKDKYQKPFKPLMPDVAVAEFNDIESAQQTIGARTAAVIIEPIQGEGGIQPASPEFLQALRELCNEHDAVLIFDEIQCGMGRTGKMWAHEHSGVTPDIMTVAKPLGGGLPIGAILVTEEIASFVQPGDHATTFGGGPVVTAAGKYVVNRVSAPEFLEHIEEVGDYLIERLQEINSPHVQDVRGRGLMVALELDTEVAPLIQAGYEQGLLMVNSGTHVLRFLPPLIVEKSDVDLLIERLHTILERVDD